MERYECIIASQCEKKSTLAWQRRDGSKITPWNYSPRCQRGEGEFQPAYNPQNPRNSQKQGPLPVIRASSKGVWLANVLAGKITERVLFNSR